MEPMRRALTSPAKILTAIRPATCAGPIKVIASTTEAALKPRSSIIGPFTKENGEVVIDAGGSRVAVQSPEPALNGHWVNTSQFPDRVDRRSKYFLTLELSPSCIVGE